MPRLRLVGFLFAVVLGVAAPSTRPVQARWQLDSRPALILGASESDTTSLLQTVVGATRLPDGSVLVGDRGEFALKRFGPTGSLLRSFARRGSGPGEVRFLGRMLRCGDSVYTYDVEEGYRYSVFTLDGRYVRTFRFWAPTGSSTPYQTACNPAGVFVHLGWESSRDMKAGTFRSVVPVWVSGADSAAGRLLDSVPGSERFGLVRDGQLRGTRPLPLGKEPVLGIGRTQLYVGCADRYLIHALDVSGTVVATLQRAETPVPVTRADVQAAIDREVANRGEHARRGVEQAFAEMRLPTTLPSYTALVVDADDRVWVRPYARGTTPRVEWTVFDASGTILATVEVPVHLTILEIGRDYVLGRYLDPDEAIPQVHVHRLTRGGRTR